MPGPAGTSHEEEHRTYFREVLDSVRRLMGEKYGLRQVSIRPIGTGGSRLSIPVRMTGTDGKGQRVKYFGKILGNSDRAVAASIQFFKNVYLRMNAQDPIFETYYTAEGMARQQYESLKRIYDLGVPTARPYGYHRIDGGLWLVVAEYLEARPMAESERVTPEQLDTVFRYLRRMHRRGTFHGDIKPENIMVGKKVYILDVGRFRDGVRKARKRAYDLACLIASLLDCAPAKRVVATARRHYSRGDLRFAASYLDLVQRRPDINFTDETKNELRSLMRGERLLAGVSFLLQSLGLLPPLPPHE